MTLTIISLPLKLLAVDYKIQYKLKWLPILLGNRFIYLQNLYLLMSLNC